MIPFPYIPLAGCVTVRTGSAFISVGDLAPEFPGLQTVPADTPIMLAPSPGVARVFHLAGLEKIATRLQVGPPGRDICIQRLAAASRSRAHARGLIAVIFIRLL